MACKKAGEAATKSGIAELAKRVPPNQALKFKEFQTKHAEYHARVNRQPGKLPSVDWEYYKRYVRADFVKMVDEFEQKYKGVCEAFDKRHEQDTSKYFVEVDRLKQQVQDEVEKFKAASNERIKALEAKYAQIQALIPYEEMTAEEYAELLPDKSFYYYRGEPSFWPHTPDEQGPGPSIKSAHDHHGNGGNGSPGGDPASSGGQGGSSSGSGGASTSSAAAAAKSAHAQSDAAAAQSNTPASSTEQRPANNKGAAKSQNSNEDNADNLKECLEDDSSKAKTKSQDKEASTKSKKTEIQNPNNIATKRVASMDKLEHVQTDKTKIQPRTAKSSIELGKSPRERKSPERDTQKSDTSADAKPKHKSDLPNLRRHLEEMTASNRDEPTIIKIEKEELLTNPNVFMPVTPAAVIDIKVKNVTKAAESSTLHVKSAVLEGVQLKVFSPAPVVTKAKVFYPEYDIESQKNPASNTEGTQKPDETVYSEFKSVQLLKETEAVVVTISESDATKDLQQNPKLSAGDVGLRLSSKFKAIASKTLSEAATKASRNSKKRKAAKRMQNSNFEKVQELKSASSNTVLEKLQQITEHEISKSEENDLIVAKTLSSQPTLTENIESVGLQVISPIQNTKAAQASTKTVEPNQAVAKTLKVVAPKLFSPRESLKVKEVNNLRSESVTIRLPMTASSNIETAQAVETKLVSSYEKSKSAMTETTKIEKLETDFKVPASLKTNTPTAAAQLEMEQINFKSAKPIDHGSPSFEALKVFKPKAETKATVDKTPAPLDIKVSNATTILKQDADSKKSVKPTVTAAQENLIPKMQREIKPPNIVIIQPSVVSPREKGKSIEEKKAKRDSVQVEPSNTKSFKARASHVKSLKNLKPVENLVDTEKTTDYTKSVQSTPEATTSLKADAVVNETFKVISPTVAKTDLTNTKQTTRKAVSTQIVSPVKSTFVNVHKGGKTSELGSPKIIKTQTIVKISPSLEPDSQDIGVLKDKKLILSSPRDKSDSKSSKQAVSAPESVKPFNTKSLLTNVNVSAAIETNKQQVETFKAANAPKVGSPRGAHKSLELTSAEVKTVSVGAKSSLNAVKQELLEPQNLVKTKVESLGTATQTREETFVKTESHTTHAMVVTHKTETIESPKLVKPKVESLDMATEIKEKTESHLANAKVVTHKPEIIETPKLVKPNVESLGAVTQKQEMTFAKTESQGVTHKPETVETSKLVKSEVESQGLVTTTQNQTSATNAGNPKTVEPLKIVNTKDHVLNMTSARTDIRATNADISKQTPAYQAKAAVESQSVVKPKVFSPVAATNALEKTTPKAELPCVGRINFDLQIKIEDETVKTVKSVSPRVSPRLTAKELEATAVKAESTQTEKKFAESTQIVNSNVVSSHEVKTNEPNQNIAAVIMIPPRIDEKNNPSPITNEKNEPEVVKTPSKGSATLAKIQVEAGTPLENKKDRGNIVPGQKPAILNPIGPTDRVIPKKMSTDMRGSSENINSPKFVNSKGETTTQSSTETATSHLVNAAARGASNTKLDEKIISLSQMDKQAGVLRPRSEFTVFNQSSGEVINKTEPVKPIIKSAESVNYAHAQNNTTTKQLDTMTEVPPVKTTATTKILTPLIATEFVVEDAPPNLKTSKAAVESSPTSNTPTVSPKQQSISTANTAEAVSSKFRSFEVPAPKKQKLIIELREEDATSTNKFHIGPENQPNQILKSLDSIEMKPADNTASKQTAATATVPEQSNVKSHSKKVEASKPSVTGNIAASKISGSSNINTVSKAKIEALKPAVPAEQQSRGTRPSKLEAVQPNLKATDSVKSNKQDINVLGLSQTKAAKSVVLTDSQAKLNVSKPTDRKFQAHTTGYSQKPEAAEIIGTQNTSTQFNEKPTINSTTVEDSQKRVVKLKILEGHEFDNNKVIKPKAKVAESDLLDLTENTATKNAFQAPTTKLGSATESTKEAIKVIGAENESRKSEFLIVSTPLAAKLSAPNKLTAIAANSIEKANAAKENLTMKQALKSPKIEFILVSSDESSTLKTDQKKDASTKAQVIGSSSTKNTLPTLKSEPLMVRPTEILTQPLVDNTTAKKVTSNTEITVPESDTKPTESANIKVYSKQSDEMSNKANEPAFAQTTYSLYGNAIVKPATTSSSDQKTKAPELKDTKMSAQSVASFGKTITKAFKARDTGSKKMSEKVSAPPCLKDKLVQHQDIPGHQILNASSVSQNAKALKVEVPNTRKVIGGISDAPKSVEATKTGFTAVTNSNKNTNQAFPKTTEQTSTEFKMARVFDFKQPIEPGVKGTSKSKAESDVIKAVEITAAAAAGTEIKKVLKATHSPYPVDSAKETVLKVETVEANETPSKAAASTIFNAPKDEPKQAVQKADTSLIEGSSKTSKTVAFISVGKTEKQAEISEAKEESKKNIPKTAVSTVSHKFDSQEIPKTNESDYLAGTKNLQSFRTKVTSDPTPVTNTAPVSGTIPVTNTLPLNNTGVIKHEAEAVPESVNLISTDANITETLKSKVEFTKELKMKAETNTYEDKPALTILKSTDANSAALTQPHDPQNKSLNAKVLASSEAAVLANEQNAQTILKSAAASKVFNELKSSIVQVEVNKNITPQADRPDKESKFDATETVRPDSKISERSSLNASAAKATAKPLRDNKPMGSSKIVCSDAEAVESVFKDTGFGYMNYAVKGLQMKVLTFSDFSSFSSNFPAFNKNIIKSNIEAKPKVELVETTNTDDAQNVETKAQSNSNAAENAILDSEQAKTSSKREEQLSNEAEKSGLKIKIAISTNKEDKPPRVRATGNPKSFKGFTLVGLPTNADTNEDMPTVIAKPGELFESGQTFQDHTNIVKYENTDFTTASKKDETTEEPVKKSKKN